MSRAVEDVDGLAVAAKIAPVQGYSAGIPWSLHLRAYDAYCKRYGEQKALIDLEGRRCRGGFDTSELDMFVPGWREELSEIGRLKAQRDALAERVRVLEAALAPFGQAWDTARSQFQTGATLAVIGAVAAYYVSSVDFSRAARALAPGAQP